MQDVGTAADGPALGRGHRVASGSRAKHQRSGFDALAGVGTGRAVRLRVEPSRESRQHRPLNVDRPQFGSDTDPDGMTRRPAVQPR